MIGRWSLVVVLGTAMILQSCGPSAETGKPAPTSAALYARGHEYYLGQNFDSAVALLQRVVAMDSTHVAALTDLGDAQYELAMRAKGMNDSDHLSKAREARSTLIRLESLGNQESSVYDRICELSVSLEDSKAFLKYAKKNAEKYPYDRQTYNLGLAYYQSGDYASSVKVTKPALEKFRQSPYIGGFHRTLGLAYMKQDRDQSATKVLESGVEAADARLAALKKAGTEPGSADDRRLTEDRVALLTMLRKLYTTYNEQQKLERVERLLREAGQMQ